MANNQQNSNKKILIILGVLAAVLIFCCLIVLVLAALGNNALNRFVDDVKPDVEVTDNTDDEPQQQNQGTLKNPYKKSAKVTFEGLTWQVISATDHGKTIKATSPYLNDCVAESGKYVSITLSLRNGTNKRVSPYTITLVDKSGNEYSSTSSVFGCLADLDLYQEINPGLKKQIDVYFEVPANSKGLLLEVNDLSYFSVKKSKYISLGI